MVRHQLMVRLLQEISQRVKHLQEMEKQKLSKKDIPQVLHDIMKFCVLAEAEASSEGAVFVVQRMIELDSDLIILMMRIVENQINESLEGEGQ